MHPATMRAGPLGSPAGTVVAQCAVFDTAVGACGLAWTDQGICGVQLPATTREETKARLVRRFRAEWPEVLDPAVTTVRDDIVALLEGEGRDLLSVVLDMRRISPFEARVYARARAVPPGKTITYGEIAQETGDPDARAVGQALARNPFPLIVPCHRVVAAGGRLGGFSGEGGVTTKIRLLEIEGALSPPSPSLFDFGSIGQ